MSNKILVGSNFNFKNRIINGDFSIWQRGTSFSVSSSFIYTADRFKTSLTTSEQITLSKSILLDKNSAKITVDTAITDLSGSKYCHGFTYFFEGQHLYDLAINKKTVTISFWFNSNVAGEYPINLRNFTDTNTNTQTYVTSFNYNTANTPQRMEITIPLNAVWNPVIKNDNNRGFQLTIAFANQDNYITPTVNEWIDGYYLTTSTAVNWVNAAGNFIEIAELQLEEGNIATEFEKIPYDIQLQRCMRYYEASDKQGTNDSYAIIWFGYIPSSNVTCYISQSFSVRKRSLPSIVLLNTATSKFNSIVVNKAKDSYFRLSAVSNDSGTGYFQVEWSADAEL